ncbi:ATP-binding protein [Leptospira alstonii]|uniref:GHKL domain protein n=2 Tax=Leptospira alstonii TaxID=28452 RepID=M6CZY9_9LEPT|nr:ATP-binding protein [Leptospira alstonii]EMJ96016.1 GHKL domain protein [Leptospira alstonii serovar Sichuan str. 79601]EQA79833.1 GHKL domain protein [Leptospira alstonii serovar Pingchang str. 80-412]
MKEKSNKPKEKSYKTDNAVDQRLDFNAVDDVENFRTYLADIRHSWLKTLCILGFTLIPLFIALDYFMIPADRFKNFVFYRTIATILILIQYLILRLTKPSGYASLHGYFFSIVVGLMISLMTLELGGFDSSYYAGLNLVMIAVIVLIPWDFDHAVINSLLIIGSYLCLNFFFPNSFHYNILVNNLYFLSSSAVIAISINRVHFQLIRKEFYANSQLKTAKKEQDTIMNSVDEGLFIIHKVDGQYFIGEHQSESVKKILGSVILSGRKFTEVLSEYFSIKKIDELIEYLVMISSKDIDEDMIRDLNPLEREGAAIQLGINNVTKFLEFGFKRITQAYQNTDFLISIKDVTKEVEMEHQLRDNEIKAEQETQMMLSILHIGPALLQDFMEGIDTELSVIDGVLRDEENHKNFSTAIETIFRSVHSIKGNAALLDLKFLAEKANEFEEKMIVLRENKNPTWEDFLPIAYDLAKLQEVYGEMHGLVQRIRLFQNKGGDTKSALSALPEAINQLALRIASELGKKVRLIATDIDFTGISNKYAYALRDILVQLTRNAITHGIESPEIRLRLGKEEYGTLLLSMKSVGDSLCVNFRDDGSSFDFGAIRTKAFQMGKGLESEIKNWAATKLIKLTFEPVFSTAGESTLHAGRGMGMDIIKQRVKKIGGKLKINYDPGQFTEFKFIFPI